MTETLPPPFPWFGGKRRVAGLVWQRLGDVEHYVEPFFGSGAVLFGRPTEQRVETVNDKDGYVANFWRAVQSDPDAVATYADNPVNENDLTARHIWLMQNAPERLARLEGDADWYDAKIAGWWVWGLCCWIGGGWCSGKGPWSQVDGLLVRNSGQGVNRQLPHLGGSGQGVNRQLPHLGDSGRGVNRQLPHLGGTGGVGTGILTQGRWNVDLYAYMAALSARLRHVRVCCGDWSRVVTDGALSHGAPVGVFLDPPYDLGLRNNTLYNCDGAGLAMWVQTWAIEHGDNPRYRIALCGYEGEHDMPDTWECVAWTANRAYGRAGGMTANSDNRTKERVWFSPHCIRADGGRLL